MTDALISSVEINKSKKGTTVLDVPANAFIKELAAFLKEKNVIKLPKWSYLVKSSHANEVVPLDPDYMFYKAAAIARILYVTKSKAIGVGSLRSFFGKKMRRGVEPPKFMKAAGKIIREVVKQLKANGYVENYGAKGNAVTYGIVLTKQGRTELDKIASKVMKKN